MGLVHVLVVALLIAVAAARTAADDEVTSLPGWSGALPSRQYSGLVDIGTPPSGRGNMYMHYYFMEAEVTPENAPVLMWYNGGPGASSLYGLLVELGPMRLNALSFEDPAFNATGVPQFLGNPFGWTKFANVLVVDSPPPVGFSYCSEDGPAGNGSSCGLWNDTSTAAANAQFIVSWFKRFPQYLPNEFFITGESYAGVYVPAIAEALLARPDASNIRLTGLATGDGCLGTDVLCGGPGFGLGGPYWDLVFFYGHGQLPIDFNDRIRAACSEEELKQPIQSATCKPLVEEMYSIVAGYYEYNLYDSCPKSAFRRKRFALRNPVENFPMVGVGYICPSDAFGSWVALDAVREALHVPVDSNFFQVDNAAGFPYQPDITDVRPFYVKQLATSSLRMLIYNGDTDPSLSSFRTQAAWFPFMKNHSVPVTEYWRAWVGDKKVRGYVQEWKDGQFAFLTIRGAGHLVPLFDVKAGFYFMQNWVKNEPYPPYTGSMW